jgi:hypothetical protein
METTTNKKQKKTELLELSGWRLFIFEGNARFSFCAFHIFCDDFLFLSLCLVI